MYFKMHNVPTYGVHEMYCSVLLGSYVQLRKILSYLPASLVPIVLILSGESYLQKLGLIYFGKKT